MYTLIAVFVHFNHFIDLKINFHTNSYNLASSTTVVILGALWFYILDLLNYSYPTQPHSLIAK